MTASQREAAAIALADHGKTIVGSPRRYGIHVLAALRAVARQVPVHDPPGRP